MNQDEFDKFKKAWLEMMDVDVTKVSFSAASNSVQLPPLDADMVDKIKKDYMGPSPVQQMAYKSSYPCPWGGAYPGISPTDKDARGMYEYQEPERDEQGTFYGYKILHTNRNQHYGCRCEDCMSLVSPRYPEKWRNGQLRANREPSESHMCGIHCTKRMNHPELRQYVGRSHGYPNVFDDNSWVLVRCALSGTVVETEQGFRAEFAQIVGVFQDGDWTSYQDYQERTHPDSRYYPDEEFTWDESWRFRTGNRKTNSGIDTGSLP